MLFSLLAVAIAWAVPAPRAAPSAPAMDQAYVVPLPVAKAAVALLRQHNLYVSYCEPCGDAGPSASSVYALDVRPWEGDPSFWVVYVNDQGVDLAYTYVLVGDEGQAVNVALVAGMDGVSGVSPVITFNG